MVLGGSGSANVSDSGANARCEGFRRLCDIEGEARGVWGEEPLEDVEVDGEGGDTKNAGLLSSLLLR